MKSGKHRKAYYNILICLGKVSSSCCVSCSRSTSTRKDQKIQARQPANRHAIVTRPERHPNVFRLRRTWLKVAGEALDLLNLIDVAQSNTAADNTLVFEAIYDKVKQLKRIDPNKLVNQDTMVQATVIKYDCPNCLPTDNIYLADYELDC